LPDNLVYGSLTPEPKPELPGLWDLLTHWHRVIKRILDESINKGDQGEGKIVILNAHNITKQGVTSDGSNVIFQTCCNTNKRGYS
jgi:hypothetical protein